MKRSEGRHVLRDRTHLALRERVGGTHGTAGARGAHTALTLPTEQTTPLRELLQEREAGGRTQHRLSHTHYTVNPSHSCDPNYVLEISVVSNK